MELTAVLTPAEEGGYIAVNPETGTTTQGDTIDEAIANLQEATALYLSEFPIRARSHLRLGARACHGLATLEDPALNSGKVCFPFRKCYRFVTLRRCFAWVGAAAKAWLKGKRSGARFLVAAAKFTSTVQPLTVDPLIVY